MLRNLLAFFCCVTSCTLLGQNYISNGGFEEYTALPDGLADFDYSVGWDNCNTFSTSPDYFHYNGFGNAQMPFTVICEVDAYEGDAVMGMVIYYPSNDNYREYLSKALTEPLTIGQQYTFSFYVTCGEPDGYYGGIGIESLAVYLDDAPIQQSSDLPMTSITPQWTANEIVYSDDWELISFNFTAEEAYTHFALGNFLNDANTVIEIFEDVPGPAAYYFFDEFSLVPLTGVFLTGPEEICYGDSLILNATGSTNGSYTWTDQSNPTEILSTDSVLTVSPLVSTTYMVYSGLDSASHTVNVVLPNPFSLGSDTTLCEGQSLLLDATQDQATYTWQDNSNAATYEVTNPGVYSVEITTGPCLLSDSIEVSITPLPEFDLGADTTFCEGQSFTLDATVANGSYAWQDNSSLPTFTVQESGTYTVEVTVDGCSAFDEVEVVYVPIPQVDLGPDPVICAGETASFDATAFGAEYLWNDASTNASLSTQEPGWVSVLVTINGCSGSDSAYVEVTAMPEIDLGTDTVICAGAQLLLDAFWASASYEWQDQTTASSYTVTEEGVYSVTVTDGPCISWDELEVWTENCEIVLDLPNVFTPNGDASNAIFTPLFMNGVTSMQTAIYNRWGALVYETDDLAIRWKADDVSEGTYYYVINFSGFSGVSEQRSGYVTVIR